MGGVQRLAGVRVRGRSNIALGRLGFVLLAGTFVYLGIVAASVLAGWTHGQLLRKPMGPAEIYATVGGMVGLLYILPFIFRDEFAAEAFLTGRRSARRAATVWTYAFLCMGIVSVITRTTDDFARSWMVMFYAGGLAAVVSVEAAIRLSLEALQRAGRVAAQTVMLVGTEEGIADFMAGMQRRDESAARGGPIADNSAIEILTTQTLPAVAPGLSREEMARALAPALESAVTKARVLGVENVVVAMNLGCETRVDLCIEAFSVLPVAVHVCPGKLFNRIAGKPVRPLGPLALLPVSDHPLTPMQALSKRVFDIAVALVGLIVLSPLLLLVAVLIKLDSPGPVIFRQRRFGYNWQEFQIWKFRTMTVLEDGDAFVQAKAGDSRVTRIGRTLRRWNIDELPQLVNALAGSMSIVGPRPHAVAHDQQFEKRIVMYPRRLNVAPGITGWAQVNGFRGVTDTDEKMQRRVEYDLEYIDNWSMAFDVYIIVLTVLSPKAFRNAE